MASSKVGIIPAAGKAARFGGLYKELLPLPDGKSMIEHAVDRLKFCDRIVVITNCHKFHLHQELLGDRVILLNQQGYELWGAIRTAYNHFDADRYYFTMPDTYMRDDVFLNMPDASFSFGYFMTNEPERFGVFQDGKVTDKFGDAVIPAMAWGVLSWAKHISDMWNDKRVESYTDAINLAIALDDWDKWPIGDYYDCANMQRYMELLWHLKK